MESGGRKEQIQYISFNQDQGCFVCATNCGFKVYNTSPFKEIVSRDLEGGIGIAELLDRTNILLLVGGGPTPKFPPHKAIIWDDYTCQIIGELTFKSDIKRVKLRKDKIAIAIENKIYIHNLHDLSPIKSIETSYNPKGLFCFSLNEKILCCPDKHDIGFINIVNIDSNTEIHAKAHSGPLAFIEINAQGNLIGTASVKGTLIRIINVEDGAVINELRRGTENHNILSICFSMDSLWVACVSDSGTAHIFSLEGLPSKFQATDDKKEASKNYKSKFSFLKVVHSYFDSEWSYSHVKLPHKKSTIVLQNNEKEKNIIVISYDGYYYLISYEEQHGKYGQIIEKKPLHFS